MEPVTTETPETSAPDANVEASACDAAPGPAPAAPIAGGGRSRRLGVVVAGAAIVVFSLGGSVALASSPAPAPTGTAATRGETPLDPAAADAAFTKFTACMRDHGIDMPDPVRIQVSADAKLPSIDSAGGAGMPGTVSTSGATMQVGSAQAVAIPGGDKAFQAANDACLPILEAAGIAGATAGGPGAPTIVSGAGSIVSDAGPTGAVAAGIGVVGAGGDVTAQADGMKAYAACMRAHGVDVPDPVVDAKAGTVQLSLKVDPGSDAFRTANAACGTTTFGFPDLAGLAAPTVTPKP